MRTTPQAVIFGGSISAAFDLLRDRFGPKDLRRFAYPHVVERLVMATERRWKIRRRARSGGAVCRRRRYRGAGRSEWAGIDSAAIGGLLEGVPMKSRLLLVALLIPAVAAAQKFEDLAATPPMGWNSWNHFGCNVDERLNSGDR